MMDFDALDEALRELKWEERRVSLNAIRSNVEAHRYFIAFIGQFSAGKSRLINNLLGRDVLPTGKRETTPILTYVRYGTPENARLFYTDGAIREIAVEEVSSVIQNTDKWALSRLDHMEVFLNAELLRSGLILLDTPGLNTLIQRHEQMLNDSLNLASQIVYVSTLGPKATDGEILEGLMKSGMKISYVRTYCDEMLRREEDPAETFRKDAELLKQRGIAEGEYYPVSNLPDSEWFDGITKLRQSLEKTGLSVTNSLMAAAQAQYDRIREDCLEALGTVRDALEAEKSGNEQLIAQKTAEAEQRVARLEDRLASGKRKTGHELAETERRIRSTVSGRADDLLGEAEQRIRTSKELTPDNAKTVLRKITDWLLTRILREIDEAASSVMAEVRGDITIDAENMFSETMPSYTELVMEQDQETELLRTQLAALKSADSDLESRLRSMYDTDEYTSLLETMAAVERQIQQERERYQDLPPYQPQMIEVIDNRPQPSDVARMIGNLADWALLLIPGGQLAEAAKGSKLISKLAKYIGKGEKVFDIIKKGDTVKDIALGLRTMSRTYATKGRVAKAEKAIEITTKVPQGIQQARTMLAGSEAESFLDYLTIQYWAERAAKPFDRPPKFEIDREYEAAYQNEKKTIEQTLKSLQLEGYAQKSRLNAFKTQEEKLLAEKQAGVVNAQEVKAELKRRETELRKNAQQNALKKWRKDCAEWYGDQMRDQIRALEEQYLESLSERMERMQEERAQKTETKLTEERLVLERLRSEEPNEANELLRIRALISKLQVAAYA